ncbi:hypothetical protein NU195Hw_g5815t1 [Hortaea werneckii]
MPPLKSNHHCPECKAQGKSNLAQKSKNGGVCPKHQTVCRSSKHEPWVHLKTEDCDACEEADKAEERRQKKAEEDAKKAEEKKKKKNEFKE